MLDRAAAALCAATKPVALSGAGISVESGIPDFRSPGGLWTEFPPEEFATLDVFLGDPERAWRLYRALGKTLAGKAANAAHEALADLERGALLTGLVTQNIDGLHQAGGSRVVHEVHGNHRSVECLLCAHVEPFDAVWLEPGPLPTCPRCDVPLKPSVVLFGEAIRDVEAIEALLSGCDLLLVVGTSAQVHPVAEYPLRVLRAGGTVVQIDVERGDLADHDGVCFLQGEAGQVVRALADRALAIAGDESGGGAGGGAGRETVLP